jgi:hypothetical protein
VAVAVAVAVAVMAAVAAVLVVLIVIRVVGARGSIVVKATSYKLEGQRFETRRGEFFQFT